MDQHKLPMALWPVSRPKSKKNMLFALIFGRPDALSSTKYYAHLHFGRTFCRSEATTYILAGGLRP
jgi:hypothetical protein